MQASRAAIAALVLALAAGCGGSLVDRASTSLSTALTATNAARDEFVGWDKAHQAEIVAGADDRAEAETGLAIYRAKREPVLRAFTIAYTAIASAAAILPLVDHGTRPERDLILLLGDAVEASIAIKASYDALREDF